MVEYFKIGLLLVIIILQIIITIFWLKAVSRLSGGLRKTGGYLAAGVLLFLFSIIIHLIRKFYDIFFLHYPEHLLMLTAFILFIIATKIFISTSKEYLYEVHK